MTSRKIKAQPRKLPQQPRSASTVEAVLEAAAEAFARDGFATASVNQIATRAGVSIGSLYQYFPSKEALIVALIERHTSAALTQLEVTLASVRSAPLELAIRRVVAAMVEAHRSALQQALARELDQLGRLDHLQREIDTRAGRVVAAFLADRGAIAEPRIADVAFILVRAVDGLTHAALVDRPELLTSGRLLDELTALVLGYLGYPPQR